MMRIDHHRARSREVELGTDRGVSQSQHRHPLRRRNPETSLSVDRAGSHPAPVPPVRPAVAGSGAALSGEDERPQPSPSEPAGRSPTGTLYQTAGGLPIPSFFSTPYLTSTLT